ATPAPYSLSLHDALPILFPHGARQILKRRGERIPAPPHVDQNRRRKTLRFRHAAAPSELLQGGGHGLAPVHRLQRRRQLRRKRRSEEHTSELQSREKLVC